MTMTDEEKHRLTMVEKRVAQLEQLVEIQAEALRMLVSTLRDITGIGKAE